LILILTLLATVITGELSTVPPPTTEEIPEPPGFFSAAFSYLEMGLKHIFGFKGDSSDNNSTSIAPESELIRVLSNRAQLLLVGGSKPPVNATVLPRVGVIVVKEDATTQKKP
ncbi:hypothetical protein PENTCL1PPCAC_23434, partial [Pristionchus entomophagus]